MTTKEIVLADPVKRAQARRDQIRYNLQTAAELYLMALQDKDYETLGMTLEEWRYSILGDDKKFTRETRQKIVQVLTAESKTVREIQAATGAGLQTIVRDQQLAGTQASVPNGTQDGTQGNAKQQAAREREAAKTAAAMQAATDKAVQGLKIQHQLARIKDAAERDKLWQSRSDWTPETLTAAVDRHLEKPSDSTSAVKRLDRERHNMQGGHGNLPYRLASEWTVEITRPVTGWPGKMEGSYGSGTRGPFRPDNASVRFFRENPDAPVKADRIHIEGPNLLKSSGKPGQRTYSTGDKSSSFAKEIIMQARAFLDQWISETAPWVITGREVNKNE